MRTDGFVITCFATGLLTGVFTGLLTGVLTGVLTGIAKSLMGTTKKPISAYYIAHLLGFRSFWAKVDLHLMDVRVSMREQVLGILESLPLTPEQRVGVEKGIYNASLQEATQKGVRKHWENPEFTTMYSIVARRVVANLDPEAYVGNPRLIQRLQDGEFAPHEVAFMSPKELFPEHWQPLADAQTKRENIMLEGDKEGGSDMFTCKRCGKSKTKYWEMQTRGADEPMTIFIRCLNCSKTWRQ